VFAGQVSADDLPDVYALSDVFAMPSRENLEEGDVEGFGLVFLEANACAKPVIGGRSGGIPDAILDGVTGFLVDSRDPHDVARSLARILGNNDLATRMGQEGRLRTVRDYSWARVGERVQGILEAVSQGQPRRG
jgi:phosphatidylinositol alpha-1,6-mannosyltransferase